jgi:hypothetical protein
VIVVETPRGAIRWYDSDTFEVDLDGDVETEILLDESDERMLRKLREAEDKLRAEVSAARHRAAYDAESDDQFRVLPDGSARHARLALTSLPGAVLIVDEVP